jgi:predicted nucleic acid-binding protein
LIVIDTNYLIRALTAGTPANERVGKWLAARESVRTSIIAWAEYLCGPVSPLQVQLATSMVGAPEPLLLTDAEVAARLFNATGRRRRSLPDCLIAATCLRLGAALATENIADFRPFESMGLRIA